jgi:membrane-associated phospholipid phosphatase
MRGPVLAAGLSVVGALALTELVLLSGGRPLGVDLWAQRSFPSGAWSAAVTQLGSGAVLYPVLALVALARRARGASWRSAVVPLVVLAVAQMLEAVLFVTVTRPSPLGGADVSFSSGHALTAVLGWGLVALELGRPALPVALAVGGVVGVTRVGLGLHWFSDVLVGWLLAVAVLIGCAASGLLRPASALPADGAPAGAPPPGAAAGGAAEGETAEGETTSRGAAVPVGGGGAADVAPASGAVAAAESAEAAKRSGRAGRVREWLVGSRVAWVLPGVAALIALVPLLTVAGPDRMKDLLVYFGAGGTAGTGADVYQFRTVFDMPFTYPPFAAVLSEPLSRVPLGLLQALWVAATLAALVGVAKLGMRPVVTRIGLPATLALLLISAPVRSHLRFGQVGLFLVLLVAADLLRRHGHRWEGVGLGVATAVKLTPAVFLPWLLVTGKRRALVVTTLTALGATVGGLLLLWPSAHEYLWRALWDSDRFGANDVVGNQSVRGMLLRSGLPEHWASLAWLASALVLAVAGTIGARQLERTGNRLGAVGIMAALSVAVSPISWVHHLVWLVLPLAALVEAGRWRLAAGWAVLLTISLPSLGAAGLRAGTGFPAFWALLVDAQGLTAVATVLFLPLLLRHHRPAAERDPAALAPAS